MEGGRRPTYSHGRQVHRVGLQQLRCQPGAIQGRIRPTSTGQARPVYRPVRGPPDVLHGAQQLVQLLHLVVELGEQQPGVLLRHRRLVLLHCPEVQVEAEVVVEVVVEVEVEDQVQVQVQVPLNKIKEPRNLVPG